MIGCRCTQESRLTAIETKLASKKEHLHEVDEDYYHLRDKLESININVAELTTLLRENKAQEEKNDKKIDDLSKELGNPKFKYINANLKLHTIIFIVFIYQLLLNNFYVIYIIKFWVKYSHL